MTTNRLHDRRDVLRMLPRLRDAGAITDTGVCSVAADVSGRCDTPVRVPIIGRPRCGNTRSVDSGSPLFVDIDAPCRRCAACLKVRAARWRSRATVELRDAPRSWMLTLTLRPEEHHRTLCLAAARGIKTSNRVGQMDATSEFLARHRVISEELTLYLKRLRAASQAPLRYMLVAERHKSGLPHYHALVHEVSTDAPVSYRQLRAAWRWGFVHAKLIGDLSAATYVAKYLAKEAAARVRASARYGRWAYPPALPGDQPKIPFG